MNKHHWKQTGLILAMIGAASGAGVLASHANAPGPARAAVFTQDGKLIFPADYRRWIYLTSGLGMSYTPAAAQMQMFDNVFVDRAAYEGFLRTGTWPEGTMMVLESRDARQNGSINKNGHFQTGRMGVEVHVKDSARFKTGWAFYSFDDETAATMIPTSRPAMRVTRPTRRSTPPSCSFTRPCCQLPRPRAHSARPIGRRRPRRRPRNSGRG